MLRGAPWGLSSVGRASALQAEGHRFEPDRLHQIIHSPRMQVVLRDAFHARWSSPVARQAHNLKVGGFKSPPPQPFGPLAQLVEHLLYTEIVASSILAGSTRSNHSQLWCKFFPHIELSAQVTIQDN
jgi:hypothetical protein